MAVSELEVLEGVHFIQINVAIEVGVGKLSEVDLANCILDVLPVEGIGGLCSNQHSCDTINTSHIFLSTKK